MRRILMILLTLVLLVNVFSALGEEMSAADLAAQLTGAVSNMTDVKEMPLEMGEQNRAIWNDNRYDTKCALIVYDDAAQAQEAVLAETTRTIAVRAVDNCALYIHRDLGAEVIVEYHRALAQILGVELEEGEPDFVLNESKKRMHLPDCEAIKDMNDENKFEYAGTREALIAHGYKECKICKP